MPVSQFRESAAATPRRVRDEDDGDVQTPPSAQYARPDAAAVAAAELQFPPLAVDAGVAALRDRFELAMGVATTGMAGAV